MTELAVIAGFALLCGAWVIIQRSLGDERGERHACCAHLELSRLEDKSEQQDDKT